MSPNQAGDTHKKNVDCKVGLVQVCALSPNFYNNYTLRKFYQFSDSWQTYFSPFLLPCTWVTVGRLDQVQLCNRRIDQPADNITGFKCAKECFILYSNLQIFKLEPLEVVN